MKSLRRSLRGDDSVIPHQASSSSSSHSHSFSFSSSSAKSHSFSIGHGHGHSRGHSRSQSKSIGHTHLSLPAPKNPLAILPPKKVIKALYSYHPDPKEAGPNELAFNKGDFFYVIARENDLDWYEACNPAIPSARGLVPVSFFQVVTKNNRVTPTATPTTPTAPPFPLTTTTTAAAATSYFPPPPAATATPLHDSGYADSNLSQPGRTTQPSSPSLSPRQLSTDITTTTTTTTTTMPTTPRNGAGLVYGIVLYDFKAERTDELDAKEGDAIIVIARSTPDWVVAKPIGRLGGPGLVPISFLEIRDLATGEPVADNVDAVIRAGVPKVEEWKKQTAEYKNSSITLGKIDAGPPAAGSGGSNTPAGSVGAGHGKAHTSLHSLRSRHSAHSGRTHESMQSGRSMASGALPVPVPTAEMSKMSLSEWPEDRPAQQSPYGHHHHHTGSSVDLSSQAPPPPQPQQHHYSPPQPNSEDLPHQQPPTHEPHPSNYISVLAPISASIPRYTFDRDTYWYTIECKMEDGTCWELQRYYEDFYELQIHLLNAFEIEAGRVEGHPRTLPFMPGPVKVVTDAISNGRRQNLDDYIKALLQMPPHISRCQYVRLLFVPREGDFEIDPALYNDELACVDNGILPEHDLAHLQTDPAEFYDDQGDDLADVPGSTSDLGDSLHRPLRERKEEFAGHAEHPSPDLHFDDEYDAHEEPNGEYHVAEQYPPEAEADIDTAAANPPPLFHDRTSAGSGQAQQYPPHPMPRSNSTPMATTTTTAAARAMQPAAHAGHASAPISEYKNAQNMYQQQQQQSSQPQPQTATATQTPPTTANAAASMISTPTTPITGTGTGTFTPSLSSPGPAAVTRNPEAVAASIPATTPQTAIKIKISYRNEWVAIRVPEGITLPELRGKLHERLKVAPGRGLSVQVQRKEVRGVDGNTIYLAELDEEEAWEEIVAVGRGKVTLYVEDV